MPGLLTFYALCGLGAVANIGLGSRVFIETSRWWVAGLAGSVVGAMWNYLSSTALVLEEPAMTDGTMAVAPAALPWWERWPAALALVAATILARLVIAAVVPLVPDEAYYALWSTRLAAGYLDHPP